MRGGKAALGLNVALMFPHYFQMNQHPEPLLPSIALGVGALRGREWAGSAPDRGRARAGGLLSTAGAPFTINFIG